MHELVKVDGSALEYAGEIIKSDKEIVLLAGRRSKFFEVCL